MYLKAHFREWTCHVQFCCDGGEGGGTCVWASGLWKRPHRANLQFWYGSFTMHLFWPFKRNRLLLKNKNLSEEMINTLNLIHKLVSTPAFGCENQWKPNYKIKISSKSSVHIFCILLYTVPPTGSCSCSFYFIFFTAAPEKSVDQSKPPVDSWTHPLYGSMGLAVRLACLIADAPDNMLLASLVRGLWAVHATKSNKCTRACIKPLSMSSVHWVCPSWTWHHRPAQSYSSPELISSCPTCPRASRHSTGLRHRWPPGRPPGPTWRW